MNGLQYPLHKVEAGKADSHKDRDKDVKLAHPRKEPEDAFWREEFGLGSRKT